MITNMKQLLSAKEKVKLLKESLNSKSVSNAPKELINAARGQIEELIEDIEAEIKEFESIQTMNIEEFTIESLEDLFDAPIRFRLAQKMTIEEFAHKVGIHSRQIARYEANRYKNLTTNTLIKILEKLSVKLSGRIKILENR